MVQNLPLPSFEEPSLTAPPLQKEVFTAPEEISSLPQDIPASPPPLFTPLSAQSDSPPRERREPMSRMRQAIAGRMVLSQQTSALLTTFNEVNMQPLLDLRAKYKERFEKRHGIKLGIMSFFVKAVVHALKTYPVVNARIDETDIVYTDYYDIGVAVGSARGLVVPILRNADTLSLADIEKQISDFSLRAQDGRITLEEMSGGTYTITNGGVFGSMMSTPIVNPPQSAILGMHAITERAIVEDGKIVARPMMYLAQSYDHRLIDGREAVLSLVAIKDIIEDPVRLLLEI
jgi:2-oxoglutarate dehydrogenase complex dihydrolipoamide succinyltransferase (E2 component)